MKSDEIIQSNIKSLVKMCDETTELIYLKMNEKNTISVVKDIRMQYFNSIIENVVTTIPKIQAATSNNDISFNEMSGFIISLKETLLGVQQRLA